MQNFDYSEMIEAAKADPAYFKPFASFTLRRTPDSIAVDTKGKSDHYPLDIDTAALDKKLKLL